MKLIIHHSFMDANYTIVPDLLEFKPVFNPSYSYWTVKLGANMGVISDDVDKLIERRKQLNS